MKKYFKNGSALLLSFLIMSAILSSVLYIARISQRQIIESKSSDNANVAFYAAESGNEQAIYYIRKLDIQDVSTLNLNSYILSGSGASITRVVDDSILNINLGLEKDEIFQFDMYNASNLSEKSNLAYLKISWEDNCDHGSWVELTSNEWSPDQGGVYWGSSVDSNHIKKSLLNEPPYTNISSIGGSDISPDNAYQFRIRPLFCDIYDLTISAFNSNNQQIAFKNIYNIKTVGQYPGTSTNGNKQALSVSLKRKDPLSGLFDYVVFSEKSLIKDPSIYGDSSQDTFYISEPSPLNLQVNVNVNHQILTVNGTEPLTWTDISAPVGMSFDAGTGILSGKPKNVGSSSVIFKVEGSDGRQAEKSIIINILE